MCWAGSALLLDDPSLCQQTLISWGDLLTGVADDVSRVVKMELDVEHPLSEPHSFIFTH